MSGRGITSQGAFIASGTGAVERTDMAKMRDAVHVDDFGALGNDSQDDTTKIQAALDAMPAGSIITVGGGAPYYVGEAAVIGGGGVVHFQNGKIYKITGSIQVPANVTLDLNGATLKVYGTNTIGIVRKHNAGLYADNNVHIRNGYIISGDSAAGQTAIKMDTVDHLRIDNVFIHNFAAKGLWLLKSQWGTFTKLHLSNCGTGVLLDLNSDSYGSHNNKFYGYWAEGCGTGMDMSGFNNGILGGTVQNSSVVGIIVQPRGTEGAQATQIFGVDFEYHDAVFDIKNLGTHTVISECMFTVPTVPANKTKRFIRQESGDALVTNCYSQQADLAIGGSKAVIEHYGGTTRVQGGNYGVLNDPEDMVVDETNSRSTAKITNSVFLSTRSASDQAEVAFGLFKVFRVGANDAIQVAEYGDSIARGSWWSDGSIHIGSGAAGVDCAITRDGAGSLVITSGSGQQSVQLLRVKTGIYGDDPGFKAKRLTTGSIATATDADVTCAWGTAFPDTNYTVSAAVVDSTAANASLKIVHITSIAAGSVVVRVRNDSAGSLTGTLHVIAVHD